jgi:CubicO group peptidase (beta-lactamase class C family)
MTTPAAEGIDLEEELADWPVGSAVAAVIGPAGILSIHDDGERYRWASVTKLLTALVVLDAAWRGEVDLDEPAGPPGSTVRHLLAHASGLAFDDDRTPADPGQRRIYSNRGYELVADHVEQRLSVPFAALLAERILDRLGMVGTRLSGSPAHGAEGPLGDLVILAHELLNPDALPTGVVPEATQVAFPGLAGVLPGFGRQAPNDWGLGFELRAAKEPHWTSDANSPATFGHFGQSGAFLWVDPAADVACVAAADIAFGPWAADRWPRLSDRVLRVHGSASGPPDGDGRPPPP